MRQSIAVGVCLVIAAFVPGCPKDDNSGGDTSSQDGGSSGGGSGGQQQMSGAGHSGDTSHSGTGGSGTNSGGNNGGNAMHGGSGGGGSVGHDAGTAHDAGQMMTDAGTGGDITDAGTSSDAGCDLKCDLGSHCELVQVECIQAPCPPEKQCVPDEEKKFCGGFAGLECPGGGTCVDDPSDDCDPMHGGADCGGICVCDKAASCVQGKHWDGRPSVCDCVSDTR
jgi:hypothetical protein